MITRSVGTRVQYLHFPAIEHKVQDGMCKKDGKRSERVSLIDSPHTQGELRTDPLFPSLPASSAR